jgi:imidazolonepropionase-like amidohydrolase
VDGGLLSMMVEQGMTYIPTLGAIERRQDGTTESLETALLNTRLVHQAGVPVAAGSGAVGLFGDRGRSLHDELALLVAAGLTPEEAIGAATLNSARLLGVDAKLGTVEENKLADLLILGGDPLEDIRAISQVQMVIQDGRIMVNRLSNSVD